MISTYDIRCNLSCLSKHDQRQCLENNGADPYTKHRQTGPVWIGLLELI